MGVMVWGEGRVLRLTLGRADVWDHRGGLPWTEGMTFVAIRGMLEGRDEAGLRAMFEGPTEVSGPRQPTILPIGRLELSLPGELRRAGLEMGTGVVWVEYDGGRLELELAARDPVLLVRGGGGAVVRGLPSGEFAAGTWEKGLTWEVRKLPAPERLDRAEICGWVQALPVDPAVCAGWRWDGEGNLWVVTDRGHDAADAVAEAGTLLARAIVEGAGRLSSEARAWWAEYWADVPRVEVPDGTMMRLHGLGLYKLGAATNPRGVACGLQGPWIEDDRTPPWSSDYHFNINVQMCYGPAYAAGLGRHLRPLWKMLTGWEGELRENARKFVGIGDGLMLPHSVDDRCTNMGGFWSGTVDHGCTAWVAKMMFDAWDYGLEDDGFLGEVAWRWMVGALNVYLAMMEERGDGTMVLPVTVSPEYRANEIRSWGANASFQLAACHMLLENLAVAAARLGRGYEARWQRARERLPRACVQVFGGKKQIMLWEGTELEESHRHHSHLAGIVPFEVFDPLSEDWREVTDASVARWVDRGCGQWSGWCHSWASQIHARLGNRRAAVWALEAFARFFMSSGGGAYHNVLEPGYSCMGATGVRRWNWQAMQLDGLLGSCTAVMDLVCHVRRQDGGRCHLFAGCPEGWELAGFERIRVPGGFTVSGRREGGSLVGLEVEAGRGGVFRWACGYEWGEVELGSGERRRVR